MRIVIVGGGVVGSSLASQLLRDRHDLSLVELDPQLCQDISDKHDLQIINGSGSSPTVLQEAGIEGADMVLAVTPTDEINLVVCALAAQFNVTRRIARLRGWEGVDSREVDELKKLGVTSVIHPEKVLVDHILQYVETPHALESANFEDGRMLLRSYRISEAMELAHKTPREVREEIAPDIVLFAAMIRRGKGVIPYGDTRFEPGDIVYTLFPRRSLDRFLQLVNVEAKPSRKIIITGDSYAAEKLAEALDKTEHNVTYIDPNLEHAEKVASKLNRVETLHGDATQNELLNELNVDTASFFIAISNGADYNMLSALLAKAEGAHEVIVTSTESHHDRLFHSIGIDHVINPRLTTAREIMEIISRGHIGAVVKFSDIDIEAVRFVVEEGSAVAGASVSDVAQKLKKGTIISVIVRDDRLMLPQGDTIIETGDHIIVITYHQNLSALSKLFKPNRFFGLS